MHALRLALLACSWLITIANVSWAVQTVPQEVSLQNAIPLQLLDSADAILRAGGYRPAATAYAQLNVRYGSSDVIFTRRFVAQIACHDWDQAAVVLASAEVAEYHISREVLPAGGLLAELLPGSYQQVAELTERLAAWVLTAPDQHEAMRMMGVWLQLSGDDSRAALFFTMAAQFLQEEIIAEPWLVPATLQLSAPQLFDPQSSAPQPSSLQPPPPPVPLDPLEVTVPLVPAPVVPEPVPAPITAEELPTPRSNSSILSLE